MLILWWRQRKNYFWPLDKIFLPGALHGASGLISTFVNVYGTPDAPVLGVSNIATLAVTDACTVIFSFLTIFYWFRLRRRVKKRQHQGMGNKGVGEK